jgi:HAD superfamily hydrolase (TIGR01450 family)
MGDLRDIDCYLVDMDGTIYLGDRIMPGAVELLNYFIEKNILFYFFTNNSSKSKKFYSDKMKRLGLGFYPEEKIISSTDVAADYIKKNFGSSAKAYIMGTDALVEHLVKNGITYTDTETPHCVVVGFDTSLTYAKVQKTVEYLRSGVPFLATNIDALCPLDGGEVLTDCGSICAMLTHATGRQPKFLGKPSPETALYIQSFTKVPSYKTAVIGDRLYTDMRFAVNNGMCALGVLSGEMTLSDIENSDITPDRIYGSVKDIYEELVKISERSI